ncbi:MAG: GNAT family N-acetyltransferase [Pseudomonadota bacterium]
MPRLILRRLDADDARAIVRLLDALDVARTTASIPHPCRAEHAERWIAGSDELGPARAITADGRLIGVISFNPVTDGATEIGYWLGQPFWGQGFIREAVDAMIAAAFQQGSARRITAQVFDDNPASARVLERCGFDRVGRGTGASVARGRRDIPETHFACTRDSWHTRHEGCAA